MNRFPIVMIVRIDFLFLLLTKIKHIVSNIADNSSFSTINQLFDMYDNVPVYQLLIDDSFFDDSDRTNWIPFPVIYENKHIVSITAGVFIIVNNQPVLQRITRITYRTTNFWSMIPFPMIPIVPTDFLFLLATKIKHIVSNTADDSSLSTINQLLDMYENVPEFQPLNDDLCFHYGRTTNLFRFSNSNKNKHTVSKT